MGKLSGLRVIDFSRVMSGPFCTALLADLGAEVIKIEMPQRGDDSRHFGPYVNGTSLYFALLNRNKRSVTLDLKKPRALELVRRLVRDADVVVENFRPGVAQGLGLDYDSLKSLNPRLVYLSISGFGQDGAMASWPAYDLVIQAMSGLMSITGHPGGPPTCVGESIGDLWAGLMGSWAILAALYARERTGQGDYIDLAMFDALHIMQVTGLSRLAATGLAPERVGNRHPVTVPVDCFRARDGWVVIVVSSDAQFAKFARVLGRPELPTESRFATNAARAANEPALRAMIEQWTSGHAVAEIVEGCLAADIPAGPVWTLAEAADRARAGGRALERPVDHPVYGRLAMTSQPARFRNEPPDTVRRDPLLGEDNEKILRGELGLTADEYAALQADKTL